MFDRTHTHQVMFADASITSLLSSPRPVSPAGVEGKQRSVEGKQAYIPIVAVSATALLVLGNPGSDPL